MAKKKRDGSDARDALRMHLKKALGIIGLAHGAANHHGPLGGEKDWAGAAWAVYDELESALEAVYDLDNDEPKIRSSKLKEPV